MGCVEARDAHPRPAALLDATQLTRPSPDTKERPFKCLKCRSTFVRRDLLLRHDRTVHAKDGGVPLHSEVKRRAASKTSPLPGSSKSIAIDAATLEQLEASSDGMVDLETAAMLMTDLHHKATAAMSSHHDMDAMGDGLETAITPNGTALIDPSVTYSSGAVPQMPWDAFMPHSIAEPTAHSISSSVSGSHDSPSSQPSLTSISTIHPNAAHMPSIMERQRSAGDVLAPSIQAMAHPLMSGAATPGAYSPYGYLPPSPLEYRRSPAPHVNGVCPPRAPAVDSDDERNVILDNIRDNDSERAILDTFRLPARTALNKYLSEYFSLFHHHLPFVHPTSFKPTQMSPPLLLAVLSIGALYTFDQEQAYMLHIGSKVLVNQFLQNKENFSSRKCPLWTMQSSLLNMIFASWSGDPKGLEWACSIKSLLANVSSAAFCHYTSNSLGRWSPVIDTSSRSGPRHERGRRRGKSGLWMKAVDEPTTPSTSSSVCSR